MKQRYRFLFFFTLAFLCAAAVNAGANREDVSSKDGKINVTTSIFAPYDFVRRVAGDRVNLTMLLPPGTESHSFEPTPRDIINIQNSNVFIYIGGETDQWVGRILESMNTDGMKILSMMDAVEVVEEELVEGMEDDADEHHGHEDEEEHEDEHEHEEEHEHEHEEGEPVYDEHVWTSPKNALLIVRAITELLCEADAANAEFFRQNAAAYSEELAELDAAFGDITAGANRRTIVFGDRFPFRYFVDAYGLDYYAAFPGCSTESEPSAATVAFLINKIKAEKIPVVFHIELSNEKMADTISGETGAKKLLLHACHNVTKRDFDSGLGYLDFMRRNAQNLKEALN